MGKLIVIEGVDSSGKATQTGLLVRALTHDGAAVRKVSFPDYDSDFSVPVKRYLAGDLGSDPNSVSPYAASLFYAIDRYASCRRDWGAFYEAGGTVVADRYVTSNLVHQAGKLQGDKRPFIEWLSDLEYGKLALPVPDLVLFLDMPPQYAMQLMQERKNKFTGGEQKDIHESSASYLEDAYRNATEVAALCGWHTIACVTDGAVRPIADIADEIYACVKAALQKG